MRIALLGAFASLDIGAFVANAQGDAWDIKRQPWASSTQQWSESAQWSEQWKWTANQHLPAAPGTDWQFSQSNTVAPPVPPGVSSPGKWTWIPSPASAGFFWSYSSSSSAPSSSSSSSQGPGVAPGTPWQFSQSNTTPPPNPSGQSVGSWTWVSSPSGGYYWSFVPGPKQELPTAPGTAWQFSQSNSVAPPLPEGSSSGSWKWISAPSGGGYYWSFIAGPRQKLPPAPGSQWIFSTSSTTAPPLPAGAPASGSWKWVSSPDGKGYFWSFIPSVGNKTPQRALPDPPIGGSGWIFSTSSTTPPTLPGGISGSGSWKWVSSPDGKGYLWSFISSPKPQESEQKLPEPPSGGSGWIFSSSSTVPPPVPAGSSSTGSWKWVSAPNGNGYYWSYISSPTSPQEQLPPPQSGSTEWIFSPSKTTPPSLPQGISDTPGSWKWVSAPNGNGYYWSFTPSSPSSQQLPSPKPGSTGWVFSSSNTTPPTIPGTTGSGSWTWISSGSQNGYYWSWSPGADSVSTGQQEQGTKPGSGTSGSLNTKPDPGTGGSFDTKPSPGTGGSFDTRPIPGAGGSFDREPRSGTGGSFNERPSPGTGNSVDTKPIPGTGGSFDIRPGTGGSFNERPSPGTGGSFDTKPRPGTGGSFDKIPSPGTGGSFDAKPSTGDQGQVPNKGPFGGSFDQTGKPITGGHEQTTQPGTQGSGNFPLSGGDIPQDGVQPQTGDKGETTIKDPFGGSFDHTGRPVDTTGHQGTGEFPGYPSTGDQGQAPIKGPFGGSFDHTGKPHSGGDVPTTQPGTQGSGENPSDIKGPFGGSFDHTGKPLSGGDVPTTQPGTQGSGDTPSDIKGPFGGSFDHTGKPLSGGDVPTTQPGTQGSGDTPSDFKGPFGGSFDHTGKPLSGGDTQPGTQGSGDTPSDIKGPFGGSFDHTGKPLSGGDTQPGTQGGDTPSDIKGPFGGSFDHTGKPISGDIPSTQPGTQSSGNVPIQGGDIPQSGNQPQNSDQGQVPIRGPFGGSFDHTGRPIDTTGEFPGNPSSGDQPGTNPGSQGQVPSKGQAGGSFDEGRPVDTTGGHPVNPSTGDQSGIQDGHSSGNIPVLQPVTTGERPSHENPQTGGTGSVPGSGDAGVINGPFGGSFDSTGKPLDTTQPINGGGSTTGDHSSGSVNIEQPGSNGEAPPNPQNGGEGSGPDGGEDDVIKGPFGGSFDKTGRPIDTGSQGKYKCPPRSRIELLDAPTVPEAICPNSQDRRYTAEGGKDFYILCCRHVDGGKKELAVIPKIPSLQYCINICAGFPGCKSVLYTARQGYKSNYPLQSCQLFEHGDYNVQTPCNNDAHDSAYLIEPPTGTTGDTPPPPIQVDPPITPPVTPPNPTPQVDIPPSFIMLPPGITEQCAQSVFEAIRCGTCAGC